MSLAARIRRFYWKRIRRYEYEICGRPDSPHEVIRHGCGRPVEIVWRAPTGIWNYVVAGEQQTTYTVRKGSADGPVEERAEGVGGTLCLHCFNGFAEDRGVTLFWNGEPQ